MPGPLAPNPAPVAPLTPTAIAGAQAAAATQAALPITPSVADKLVSAGMYAGNTALVTGAPMMGSVLPGANPTGAGGIEVSILGDGILVCVQALQVHRWFDREKWGIYVIIGLSIIFCLLLWHSPDDWQRGVLNACGAAFKAFGSFGPLSKLGILSGQTEPPGMSPG
jgi:hypothetical protein